VKTYKVQVGNTMTSFDDVDGGKVFTGNSNRSTQIEQKFAKPVMARYVRIWPQSWQGHVSMRAAVLVADCVPAEEPEKELPELPTDPGCYVHAPKGCAKRPAMNDDWFSDSHSGSATNKARCEQRAAEYDKWCPTTGTLAEFVPEHNCMTREAWSDEKKEWCCANKKLGCPEPEPEEGGYVCQETTSIFGGSRYANFNIVTKDGCAAKCDNDARCKSFDFATTPGKFACRLSKMDKPHTAAVPSRTFCKPGAEAEDPTNPTDKECQSKTSKNGCLERHCGFNESTGKCNKRCRKYGKAECPAGRCKVEGDDCTDPEDPEQEECEPKESKNGCLMRNCGWNEETGKCNKKCRKFGKAECPAGRCKVEGDNCTDPEDPEQDECEPKESKNGCIMRNCGWNEKTGKCNKKCRKFGKAECPAGRCKVEGDNCTDPEDPEQEECEPKESKNGCLLRNCGWNEETGKCSKKCTKFGKAECPAGRCKVDGEDCVEPEEPEEEDDGYCADVTISNAANGKKNYDTEAQAKAACTPNANCIGVMQWKAGGWRALAKGSATYGKNNGHASAHGKKGMGICEAAKPQTEPTDAECQTKTSRNGCVEFGCGWSEETGKCNKGCAKFSKEQCPPKRCRVNGSKCEDAPEEAETPTCPPQPTRGKCQAVQGCEWDRKAGKCVEQGNKAPETCEPQPNKAKCLAIEGCSWDRKKKCVTGAVVKTCPEQENRAQCNQLSGCYWDKGTSKCKEGEPEVVTKVCTDHVNRGRCKDNGCTWSAGKCSEGEIDCAALKKKAQCVKEKASCSWIGKNTDGACMAAGEVVPAPVKEVVCTNLSKKNCAKYPDKCAFVRKKGCQDARR